MGCKPCQGISSVKGGQVLDTLSTAPSGTFPEKSSFQLDPMEGLEVAVWDAYVEIMVRPDKDNGRAPTQVFRVGPAGSRVWIPPSRDVRSVSYRPIVLASSLSISFNGGTGAVGTTVGNGAIRITRRDEPPPSRETYRCSVLPTAVAGSDFVGVAAGATVAVCSPPSWAKALQWDGRTGVQLYRYHGPLGTAQQLSYFSTAQRVGISVCPWDLFLVGNTGGQDAGCSFTFTTEQVGA